MRPAWKPSTPSPGTGAPAGATSSRPSPGLTQCSTSSSGTTPQRSWSSPSGSPAAGGDGCFRKRGRTESTGAWLSRPRRWWPTRQTPDPASSRRSSIPRSSPSTSCPASPDSRPPRALTPPTSIDTPRRTRTSTKGSRRHRNLRLAHPQQHRHGSTDRPIGTRRNRLLRNRPIGTRRNWFLRNRPIGTRICDHSLSVSFVLLWSYTCSILAFAAFAARLHACKIPYLYA